MRVKQGQVLRMDDSPVGVLYRKKTNKIEVKIADSNRSKPPIRKTISIYQRDIRLVWADVVEILRVYHGLSKNDPLVDVLRDALPNFMARYELAFASVSYMTVVPKKKPRRRNQNKKLTHVKEKNLHVA